jgi:hypothetical protein
VKEQLSVIQEESKRDQKIGEDSILDEIATI